MEDGRKEAGGGREGGRERERERRRDWINLTVQTQSMRLTATASISQAGYAAGCSVALALVAVVAIRVPEERVSLMGREINAINQRIHLDEQRLGHDIEVRNRLMQSLTTYPDGCSCTPSNCKTPKCDEIVGDGPLCKCPMEGQQSMPGPATPWPLGGKSVGTSNLRQMHASSSAANQRRRSSGINRAVMPPYSGAQTKGASGNRGNARFQQKWVGQPPKLFPTDGDYPGGSTGLPEDGYVAFETGYGNDGPYHGLILPMQETGMMSEPDAVKSEKAETPQSLRQEMQGPPSSTDDYVPARKVPTGYFQGSTAYGPTVNAVSSLF